MISLDTTILCGLLALTAWEAALNPTLTSIARNSTAGKVSIMADDLMQLVMTLTALMGLAFLCFIACIMAFGIWMLKNVSIRKVYVYFALRPQLKSFFFFPMTCWNRTYQEKHFRMLAHYLFHHMTFHMLDSDTNFFGSVHVYYVRNHFPMILTCCYTLLLNDDPHLPLVILVPDPGVFPPLGLYLCYLCYICIPTSRVRPGPEASPR